MLILKKIRKIYNEGKNTECRVFDNLNIEFPDQGLFIIKGRNGSGKTTLLNIISGFDKATSGEIITNYSNDKYASFVFQDFQLIDYLNVENNLKIISKNGKDYIDYLKQFGLYDIRSNYPNQISGGQKQRIAIIRALLLDKPVLLCDEPTANLDLENSKIIENDLIKISKEKLVIVITHDEHIFDNNDGVIDLNSNDINYKFNSLSNKPSVLIDETYIKNSSRWLLIKNFIHKKIVKHIFMFITLFLSFLLMISAFNGLLNKKSSVIYKNYNKENMSLDVSKSIDGELKRMTPDDLEKYKKKYNGYEFYDSQYYMNNISVSRIYIKDRCEKEIICGTNIVNDNQIIISDFIAKKINFNISDVCGKIINNLEIVGIFKTNEKYYKKEENQSLYESIYMNNDTFYSFFSGSNFYFDCIINNKLDQFSSANKDANLKDNEIVISYGFSKLYFPDYMDAIGKTITIEFADFYDYKNNIYRSAKYQFTIKGLTVSSAQNIFLSENKYNEISRLFNKSFHGSSKNGISIEDYSKKDVANLLNDNFVDNTYLTIGLEEGLAWLLPLNFIELGVGIILLIISLIVIINFVHNIFEREKKTIGILTSIGWNKIDIVRIYFIDISTLVGISFATSAILEIFVVKELNSLLKKIGISNLNCLYYEINSILLFAFIFILIVSIIFLVMKRRINKKSIIDLVYLR